MRLDSLYQDVILDHYRHPRSRGLRDPFDAEVHHRNPTCGDEVTLRVRVDRSGTAELLADVSYAGQGCSISQASASVLTELVTGTSLAQAEATHTRFVDMIRGTAPDDATAEALQDAVAFAGVSQYPARVRCALLPWMALREALALASADVGHPGDPGPAGLAVPTGTAAHSGHTPTGEARP